MSSKLAALSELFKLLEQPFLDCLVFDVLGKLPRHCGGVRRNRLEPLPRRLDVFQAFLEAANFPLPQTSIVSDVTDLTDLEGHGLLRDVFSNFFRNVL